MVHKGKEATRMKTLFIGKNKKEAGNFFALNSDTHQHCASGHNKALRSVGC